MFETAIEKAQAQIHKLRDARTELEAKAEAAGAELAKLREGAGEAELAAILEGIEVGPIRARAVELDMQISGLAGARMALMKRIAAAEKALQTAKAEGIRAEGGKLQKKLSEHLAESRRLQAALEKHEGGCPYIPLAEAQSALMAANPGTPADRTVLKWPDSMRLQQEINALMAKAEAVENGRVEAGGLATGANLAELLADVANNPMAPLEAEVRQAFAEMEAAAIDAWERHITGDFALHTGPRPDERLTSFQVAWIDGRVDRQRSAWRNDRRAERFDPNKPKPALSKPAATGDPNEEAAFEEAFKAW